MASRVRSYKIIESDKRNIFITYHYHIYAHHKCNDGALPIFLEVSESRTDQEKTHNGDLETDKAQSIDKLIHVRAFAGVVTQLT